MTGLEKVQDLPEVRVYLFRHRVTLCTLMPDWPGWDCPHVMTRRGGILPMWPERLLYLARRSAEICRWLE